MSTRIVTCVVVLTLIAIGWGRGARSYAQEGGDGPPPVGSPVSIIGVEGTEVAQITVTEVEDPFEDYDPNSPPDRSYRFVLVHLEVENTGTRPYPANAYGVSLQDTDGFLYLQTYLFRTEEQIAADPDFPNDEIGPGDTASGVVAFQVLQSASLVRVVYQPAYDRLIFLADLTKEGAPPPADDEDIATPAGNDETDNTDDTASGSSSDDDEGADADAAAIEVSAGDCDDIQEWIDEIIPEIDALSEAFANVAAEDPIAAETLEDAAADLQDAADNVRDSNPPRLLEASAEMLADALDGYAELYLDAAEEGEEISVEDLFTEFDTSEPDELLAEAGATSDPILAACGIDS